MSTRVTGERVCILLVSMVIVVNRNVWIRRDDVKVIGSGGRAFSHAGFCSDGQAPIHKAAVGGHLSALELLIAKNADVNARDK